MSHAGDWATVSLDLASSAELYTESLPMPDYRELIYAFEQNGHEALCTFAYREAASPAGGGVFPEAALDTAEAAWSLWLKPMFNTHTRLVEIRSQAPYDTVIRPVGLVGEEISDPIPVNNAVVMVKHTEPGVPNGRTYWPGSRESDWTGDGRLTTSALGAWGTAFTNWYDALTTGLDGTKAPVPLAQYTSSGFTRHVLVESVSVRSVIGVQRRRLDA